MSHCELDFENSAYIYVGNNPINHIDMFGMYPVKVTEADGSVWGYDSEDGSAIVFGKKPTEGFFADMQKGYQNPNYGIVNEAIQEGSGAGVVAIAAPIAAIFASPYLATYAPAVARQSMGGLAFKEYATVVAAGMGADLMTQVKAIFGDPNKKYNLTSTLVQLYQGPGANKLQPLFASVFNGNPVSGMNEKSINGADFSILDSFSDMLGGYLGNKISDKFSGGAPKLGDQYFGERIGNAFTENVYSAIVGFLNEPINTNPVPSPSTDNLLPITSSQINNNSRSPFVSSPAVNQANLILNGNGARK